MSGLFYWQLLWVVVAENSQNTPQPVKYKGLRVTSLWISLGKTDV